MKQKNLVLMVVAVGIGLAAAFLTSQLGARSSGPSGPEMIKVLVAKRDLPIGTRIAEEDMDKLIEEADFPKASLPPKLVNDREKLKGKRLTRTLRKGDKFLDPDITNATSIQVPSGKSLYAVAMDVIDAAAGFALPGNKVDVILVEVKDAKKKASIFLRNMLVVAVDIMDRKPEGAVIAVPQLKSVSLAVTPKEALQLALAQKRGEIKLLLRNLDDISEDVIAPVTALSTDTEDGGTATPVIQQRMVSIPVATNSIDAGAKITRSNKGRLFRMMPWPHPGPPEAVSDLGDLDEKYLKTPLAAGQFVTRDMLATNPPGNGSVEPLLPQEPLTIYQYHTLRIQNGPNTTTATYKKRDGANMYQMTKDGAFAELEPGLTPAPLPRRTRPNPEPRPEPPLPLEPESIPEEESDPSVIEAAS